MGVARAPVTGSGIAPAWIARVPNAYSWSAPSCALPLPMSLSWVMAGPVEEFLGGGRRETPCFPPDPVEPAEQARVLDLHAAVHHHVEPRLARLRRRAFVDHADLHPQAPGA